MRSCQYLPQKIYNLKTKILVVITQFKVKKAVTLATVATEFLERPGLAPTTRETYFVTLSPLLYEYGSWAIDIISKQTIVEYLNSLSHLKYTTHLMLKNLLLIYNSKCSQR